MNYFSSCYDGSDMVEENDPRNLDIVEYLVIYHQKYLEAQGEISDRMTLTIHLLASWAKQTKISLKSNKNINLSTAVDDEDTVPFFCLPVSQWKLENFSQFVLMFLQMFYSVNVSLESLSGKNKDMLDDLLVGKEKKKNHDIEVEKDDSVKVRVDKLEVREIAQIKSEFSKIIVFISSQLEDFRDIFLECWSEKTYDSLILTEEDRNLFLRPTLSIEEYMYYMDERITEPKEHEWMKIYDIISKVFLCGDNAVTHFLLSSEESHKIFDEWVVNRDIKGVMDTIHVPTLSAMNIIRAGTYNTSILTKGLYMAANSVNNNDENKDNDNDCNGNRKEETENEKRMRKKKKELFEKRMRNRF
jgi:hypothetical protein